MSKKGEELNKGSDGIHCRHCKKKLGSSFVTFGMIKYMTKMRISEFCNADCLDEWLNHDYGVWDDEHNNWMNNAPMTQRGAEKWKERIIDEYRFAIRDDGFFYDAYRIKQTSLPCITVKRMSGENK